MKKIFISFDYDNDRRYRFLLSALKSNARSEIVFDDLTPEEIQTSRVDRVKGALDVKLSAADYTLVIIGRFGNSYHPDRQLIGTRNWQWWEIERAKDKGHGFISVKIDANCETPLPLYGAGSTWARAFRTESILAAINAA